MKEIHNPHSLRLTEEEAMGLLDIVMLSPGEFTPEQRAAVLKLSEFCREWIREEADALNPAPHTSLSPNFAA